MKKKIYALLFSLLLIFSMISFNTASAETPDASKDIKTLVSELIYYYGQDARTDVLRTLDLIEEQSLVDYKLWNSVIDYWDWIENDMEEHIDVAPDGLPNDNTHAFIVLGFALKPDGTMEDELVGRLQVALNSAKKYPNSYVLVTGGVMKNGWTEGDRMRDWLLANGLPMDRIIVENKSANTVQNASFSYDILYNNYNIKTASIISSQYHLKRASIFYYTMSLLKAKELGKTPIEFLGQGNAGWYRADKTEEPMSLKVSGMSSIAGVPRASNLPISKLVDLAIEGDLEYYEGEDLNLSVHAQYDCQYVRDITKLAEITGFDSSKIGDQELQITYEEKGVRLTKNIVVSVAANKTALEKAVGDAEKKVKADYTGKNWKDFTTALILAKQVLGNKEATQAEVDAVLDSLIKATESLVKKPVVGDVDKSALDLAVTDAKKKQASDYTASSWTAFKKALASAKAVLANPTSSQEEVDTALNDLNVASSKLVFARVS
ncbi:ElyC/SanA/YdcF family protein [Bacillus sp. B-jedd]|uniref:ElyC/SanA/YdcF family protein n=1 Tax=Bacillus sp. B-jedd TaxID=1476857 RepID=UPI000515573F|nr:ElyC/SanA/YdcF family protein [Bacillus sp. B-jedd]CEG26909.1 cytoplasmic protein [Bacillus sp. B-jedd]